MKVFFSAPKLPELEILKSEGAGNILISIIEENFHERMQQALSMGFNVMIDSAAYSVMSKGVAVELEYYEAILKEYAKYAYSYANLDVIGNSKETNYNQLWLESKGFKPLPVYHYGEPKKVLQDLAQKYEYIGIGGLVKPLQNSPENVYNWIYETTRNFNCRFHGFGVGNLYPKVMGLFSVDSTTWISAARYGRQIGANGVVRGAEYKLFWRREELLRHNIRALLWKQDNVPLYKPDFFEYNQVCFSF